MRAAMRRAEQTPGDDALWKAARREIAAANALEPDHPAPLIAYHESFAAQGDPVPDLATQGLRRAFQLAPFARSVRMDIARGYLEAGNPQMARAALLPPAHNPHRSALAEEAAELVAKIDAGEVANADAGSAMAEAEAATP